MKLVDTVATVVRNATKYMEGVAKGRKLVSPRYCIVGDGGQSKMIWGCAITDKDNPDGDKEGGDDNQGHYPCQAASDDDKIEVLLQKSSPLPLLSRVSCVLVTV